MSRNIVNSLDVENYYTSVSRSLQDPRVRLDLEKYGKNTAEVEKAMLLRGSTCTIGKLEEHVNKITRVNPLKLKELLQKNFYDPTIMQEILCTVNSLFYLQPSQSGAVKPNERIKRWLKNLQQIGEPSAFGYALKSDFSSSKSTFIIKAPRDLTTDLLHEVIVGLQLNSLRASVPNFAYVFGGFKCTPPVLGQLLGKSKPDVIAWCDANPSFVVQYAVYENIAPAVSFRDYIKGCTFEQFLDKYLQILFAELAAQELLDFTHYDAHPGNILIKTLNGEKISIPYTTEKGTIEYILTDGISTFIDYGLSHIQVDGVHLGVANLTPHGVQPNRSSSLQDAYKLLMSSLFTMDQAKNTICYQKARRLYTFFSTEPLESALPRQLKNNFFLPPNQKTDNVTLRQYLGYIRSNIAEYSSVVSPVPRSSKVLGCTGNDICVSEGQAIELLGYNTPMKIDNVFDFFDLVSRFESEGRNDEIAEVVSLFDVNKAINDALHDYDAEVNIIRSYFADRSVQTLSICGLQCNDVRIPAVRHAYKNFLIHTAQANEMFQQADLIYSAIKFVVEKYPVYDTSLLDQNYNNLMLLYADFRMILDGVRNDAGRLGSRNIMELELPEMEVLSRV